MVWFNGKSVEQVGVSLLSHSLHYGGAVFEGLRFYKTASGRSAIFRLGDHLKRLYASAQIMDMEIPYTILELQEAVVETVRQSGLTEGYIRPIVFRGDGMGLMATGIQVYVAIIVLPWPKGMECINLSVPHTIRLHPDSTNIHAKTAGHYVNSYMAARGAKKLGAHDALLLDWQGNIAEASVANVFFVKGESVFTPKTGNIFAGLTRDTMIVALSMAGTKVEERNISLTEALQSDAAFIVGTACEVLPVASLNGEKFDFNHSTVVHCREKYQQVVTGTLPEAPSDWLTYVN